MLNLRAQIAEEFLEAQSPVFDAVRACWADDPGSRLRSRFPIADNNPQAKLDETSVRVIRLLAASGWTQREIAKRFGVSQETVWKVLRGKTWAHVQGIGA